MIVEAEFNLSINRSCGGLQLIIVEKGPSSFNLSLEDVNQTFTKGGLHVHVVQRISSVEAKMSR